MLKATRLLPHAAQTLAGVVAGLALGLAASEARAADTVESLLANPERLAAVQRGCKTNQPWATGKLCAQAAEAIRRRFRGVGVHYTPKTVDPFPTRPKPAPEKAGAKSTYAPPRDRQS